MEFSISQVISGTFGMVKERFGSLLGIYFLYFAIMIAVMIVFFMAVGGSIIGMAGLSGLEDPAAMGAGLGVGMILAFILFYVVYILLAFSQVISLTAMASPLQEPGFGQAMRTGLRSWLTMLGLLLVVFVAYIVLAVIAAIVGAALMAIGDAGAVVFGLICLVGLVYLACRLSVLYAVIAVEGVRNPLTAIARSWSLTRGKVLPIFLVTLVFVVLIVVAFGLAFAPMLGTIMGAASGAMDPSATPAVGGIMGSFALIFVMSVLISIVYCAFMAVLHAALAGRTAEDFADTFE